MILQFGNFYTYYDTPDVYLRKHTVHTHRHRHSQPSYSTRLVIHFMHTVERRWDEWKSYIASSRDSLMRLRERRKEPWIERKHEGNGADRGRDCSGRRLINVRVSLTSAREKSLAAQCLDWKGLACIEMAVCMYSEWKQFLARREYIASALLLSNGSLARLVLENQERNENDRIACKF